MTSNLRLAPVIADGDAIISRGREVVRIEAEALAMLEGALDDGFVAACEAIFAARRRLAISGMGKSGHIGRKIAATFAATGTPAVYIHPAEAAHGDLGMLMEGDVLLVLSSSGNTAELRTILSYARSLGITIIGVTLQRNSLLMERADIAICLPDLREACSANIAPTTSTTLQLALGDAMAMAVMDMRGISRSHLRALHPGGMIGLRLAPVKEIMHCPDRLPLVGLDAGMGEVISIMTSGRFGMAGVVNADGELAGMITDGDLRRHFDALYAVNAAEVMTVSPKTLPSDMLGVDALSFLNHNKITAAFVVDSCDTARPFRPVGVIHIHDLLRLGLD